MTVLDREREMGKHLDVSWGVTYTLTSYKQLYGARVLESYIDEQTRRCEHLRVDLDDGNCDQLLLVRGDVADMLDFVERHRDPRFLYSKY